MSLVRVALAIAEDRKPQSDQERERVAVRTLRSNMTARRLGVTYILEVSYQSLDPEKAARIANAFVNAYVIDQLDTKFQATKRATGWLQERIEELRNQSDAAARAVQECVHTIRRPNDGTVRSPGRWSTFTITRCRQLWHWTSSDRTPFWRMFAKSIGWLPGNQRHGSLANSRPTKRGHGRGRCWRPPGVGRRSGARSRTSSQPCSR
jgi:hypothetical protein